MPTSHFESAPYQLPLNTLQNLLEFGRSDNRSERRAEPRFSFFAPLTLRLIADHSAPECRAFSREISRTGMGLFLNQSLPCGELFAVKIKHHTQVLQLHAQIVWCQSAGDGWFLAGCRFVEPF